MMATTTYAEFAMELLALMRATRAKSTVTKMKQVLREIGETPGLTLISDLTPIVVANYVVFCESRNWKYTTTKSLLSSLRRACRYASKTKRLEVNPFEVWDSWVAGGEPPEPKHHPRESIARVLAHVTATAEQSGTWKDRRLCVLAHLVAYTGLRKMEALRLRAEDIDLDGRVLRVVWRRRLKTPRSAAPVPIPDRLAEVLRPWLAEEKEWLIPGAARVGPWTGGVIGARPVDHLQAAGNACGVKGMTLKSLRHSWATHAEFWGLSELAVQRVLRHTRPRTQDHYRHADVVNLVLKQA